VFKRIFYIVHCTLYMYIVADCSARTCSQVGREVGSKCDGRTVPSSVGEQLLAELRSGFSGMTDSRHQVKVPPAQTALCRTQVSRSAFSSSVPRLTMVAFR